MGENKYPSWMNAFQPEAAYENLKDFLPIFKFRVIDRLFPKQMSSHKTTMNILGGHGPYLLS